MAEYNKIKLAINNNNNRLMATYKTTKVAVSQYKNIVMAIYKYYHSLKKIPHFSTKSISLIVEYSYICKSTNIYYGTRN